MSSLSKPYERNGGKATGAGHGMLTQSYLRRCPLNHADTKPVPPLSEYEAYYDTLSHVAQKKFNPRMMRRLAIVKREGNTTMEAAKLIGMHKQIGSSRAYVSMPDHLK